MQRIVAQQYVDLFTQIRVVLDLNTTQLSILVNRYSLDGEWTENEHGPFDSIGELREELHLLFEAFEAQRCVHEPEQHEERLRSLSALLGSGSTFH